MHRDSYVYILKMNVEISLSKYTNNQRVKVSAYIDFNDSSSSDVDTDHECYIYSTYIKRF